MKITWIGHSCFKIEKDGFAVVTDPYAPGSVPGLCDVKENAQLVCCSHSHGDHAYKEGVVLAGSDGEAPQITKIHGWHDDVKGTKRGENTIHMFDFKGEKVIHMGDIGCELTEDEIDILKNADVLLIPVGGYYTISPKQAIDLTKKLRPRIVIPMHFRDDTLHFGYDVIETEEPFLDAFKGNVLTAGCFIDTDDYAQEKGCKVIRMIPKNA